MLQGTLRYDNFDAEGRFTLTRSAGVAPGQISASFLINAPLPLFGDVRVGWNGQTIYIPNCRLRRKVIASSGAGRVQSVILEDRRWKWAMDVAAGPLYGYYNHYEKGIKVTSATNIRSARALATMILTWMGERVFDVSAMPDDFYPPILWDGEPPASALEDLADMVGCQVVLRWNNTVQIVTRGSGVGIPTDDRVMDYTISHEPQVIPEFVIVEAGATRFQADLPLEPVGYEPDTGEIRHVNNLSYKPATGWEKESPGQFYGVTDPALRELAQSCVWKTFRPTLPLELAVNSQLYYQKGIVAKIAQDQLWRILPLEIKQLDLWRNPLIDKIPDAQIIGYFCDQHKGWKNNASFALNVPPTITVDYFKWISLSANKYLIYRGYGRAGQMPFAIDSETGIVQTYEPLFALDIDANGNSQGIIAPPVALRTSFTVRDPDWRTPYRQQFILQVSGGQPGVVKTLRIEELAYEFSQASVEITAYATDPVKFAKECYFYATKWLNQFYDGPSAVVPMKGFAFDIDVDGAMRSVTYSRDESGRATTELEWQTERPEFRPSYKELFDKRTINQVVRKFREEQRAAARGKRNLGGGFQQGGGFGT